MISGFFLDEDAVLEHVDEYTLYCHYLEFEPEIRMNYISPLRDNDESPSFGIYPRNQNKTREFFWKDSGGTGESGDIFKLVQLLYGYSTRQEALARVKSDFGLGLAVEKREKIVRNIPKFRDASDIRVRARAWRPEDLKWWQQFNISEQTLVKYRTSALYCYWLTQTQRAPVFAPALSFVYRIYDRYQLYFPCKEKGKKFRNDLSECHVMGLEQLNYQSDTLIITKSYKDVMCLNSFGYEAVSPRSENTPMPQGFFDWVSTHYKKAYVLFDNDMKHRGEWYPYPKVYVPPTDRQSKDISDFTRDYSAQAAADLLRTLIQ
jgi:hypothetical protein